MVGRAEVTSGTGAPTADGGQRGDREQPAAVAGYMRSAQAIGSATSVPNVPGARREPGAEPECDEMRRMRHRNPNDGARSRDTACGVYPKWSNARGSAAARRPCSSWIVSAGSTVIAPIGVSGNPSRERDRFDALAHRGRRGEAELVVVAAREHATERQFALAARQHVAPSSAHAGIADRSSVAPTRDAART